MLDGVSAIRRILEAVDCPTRFLMLTTLGLDECVFEALRAGASGFLPKDAPPEQLVDAVRQVAAGACSWRAGAAMRRSPASSWSAKRPWRPTWLGS